MKKSNGVERKCEFCGSVFTIKASAIIRGRGRFCSKSCVGKYQMKINPPNQRKDKNSNYKGGKYRNPQGYIFILTREHPYNRNGYVAEHRLVIEDYLGRYLMEDEVVHHINGVKNDNRIDNLQVMTKKEHNKLHGEMRRNDSLAS